MDRIVIAFAFSRSIASEPKHHQYQADGTEFLRIF